MRGAHQNNPAANGIENCSEDRTHINPNVEIKSSGTETETEPGEIIKRGRLWYEARDTQEEKRADKKKRESR